MNKIKILMLSSLMLVSTLANAGELLTGIPKLACEAILCLSTGSPPGECSPSLSHYFGIDFEDWGDTLDARLDFLNACPVASQTPQMHSLVNAIANGAGRCDAASLNATMVGNVLTGQCINNQLPSYCSTYENHEYTRLKKLTYVIDPPKNNFWPFNNAMNNNMFGFNGYGQNNNQSCGHWVEK